MNIDGCSLKHNYGLYFRWWDRVGGTEPCNRSIGDLEGRLDQRSFLRIHRSYRANLDFAEQILRDDGKVMLKLRDDELHLPVARASTRAKIKPGRRWRCGSTGPRR